MDMYQKKEQRKNKPIEENSNNININWYPGHMAKAKRQMAEKLPLIDCIYEVVDARMPYSSKIVDIEDIIKNKPRILILTKSDLCDKIETNKFIENYKKDGYETVLIDLINQKSVEEIIAKTEKIMQPINQKRLDKGLKLRKTRVMVIGIPNVGKSTLINKLVGKKAVNVGNKPGVTKSLDWIRVNKNIELLDTPGILWPKFENKNVSLNLASLTAIKEEILPIDEVCMYILEQLKKYYPNVLIERYGIEDIEVLDMFEIIGRKRGCLTKGNIVDYDAVYQVIINDVKNGLVKGITFDRF